MFKYDEIYNIKSSVNLKICLNGVSECFVGNTFSSLITVTLYFLGYTARKNTTYLYSCDNALCNKRLACDRKIMCATIRSSNKKGHKNCGLLLKSMDYIIE